MTVALLVKDHADAAQRLVPVAVEAFFRSEWLVGARELGLAWVELMESGVDITADNVDDVVAELRRLQAWMSGRGSLYAQERMTQLLVELEQLSFATGATAWIG